MDQLRTVLAGPHGITTFVTWGIAGLALLVAVIHALRRHPLRSRWSRAAAVAFPATVGCTLLVASVTPQLRGTALEVAMFLRMLGFWAMVTTAPFAVGQLFELRPPRWLRHTHVGLAGLFLLLLATSDLAMAIGDRYEPATQFGPLAVPFLVPVAAFAGWWLLACLGQVRTRTGLVVFALGGSTTTLALVVAALVVDPTMADHFLVVAYLPVLAAASLLELQRTWSDRPHRRRRPEPATTTSSTASQ